MKALKFSLGVLFVFLTLTGFGKEEFTKKYQEEFNIDKNTTLQIVNKFGDVAVNNWDKDVISIEVTITVEASRQEKADDIFDDIKITLTQDGDIVKGLTELTDKIKNTKFSIDYEIKTPKYIKLELSNKFGDTFINEITGKSFINVKYGSLEANKLVSDNEKPLSEITLGYCDRASIKEFYWGKINIKYSKLSIDKSQALAIVSKYSRLEVEQVSSIVSEAGYDTYKIGDIQNFVCVGKYSDLSIEKLNKKLDLDIKYGGFKVHSVPAGFKSIKINAKYAGVNVGIAPDASYQLDANVEYADMDYPSGGKISKIKDNSELKVSGTIGNKPNPASTVYVQSKYGGVDLEY
jgi:hypothetical protein